MAQDKIYQQPIDKLKRFAFGNEVAAVFDDMVTRSVPLYAEVQKAISILARSLAPRGSRVYDLGCSTGTMLIGLCEALPWDDVRIIGVDSSGAMLSVCREKLERAGVLGRVELLENDIALFEPQDASLVILNYTLQFIEQELRAGVLKNIFNGLRPGGVLFVTEKVCFANKVLDSLMTNIYYDFKRSNGYSDLEISQKREALENVLVPVTTEENIALMRRSGFDDVGVCVSWFNFASFAAIKK